MNYASGKYEIHAQTIIEAGWHNYSQFQPENSVSLPAVFEVDSSTGYILIGKVKELGVSVRIIDPGIGLLWNQYSNSAEFVQDIECYKAGSYISGKIIF